MLTKAEVLRGRAVLFAGVAVGTSELRIGSIVRNGSLEGIAGVSTGREVFEML